jgi:hypothetical protein
VAQYCFNEFGQSEFLKNGTISKICEPMQMLPECKSVKGKPIPHFDKPGVNPKGKRILIIGQIHGDEPAAGELALVWAERLLEFDPQNTWRIVPRMNPDGAILNTRTNQNGIDLNRNFPTKDWDVLAVREWEAKTKKNPRRFPGSVAGSEPETRCTMQHIEDFKPDIVAAIHTPYGLLDYDGPAVKKLKFAKLPWQSIGTFPGSLGRFLWTERNVPVLTVELHVESLKKSLTSFKQLQDQLSELTL